VPPEKDTKVSQEVQDEYQSMTPIEVGGKQQLYYDVPIPPLPVFVPKPYTSYFTDPEDFKIEKERLLVARKTAYIRREQYQNDINNIEDLLNAKAYASPEGFTSTVPPFDKKARRDELQELTKETNPKTGIDEYTNLQPLLDMRDAYKLKKVRTLGTLLKEILAFEEKENDKAMNAEVSTYVGTKVAKTEAALQGDLKIYKGLLAAEEAKILNIETNITALDADYENFMRTNEENTIEENKINNERRLLATDTLNTFNRLNQGRVQIQREPQETDDQLLARLDKLGQIPVDAADVENQILVKAKKNILELTPDLTVGELVLKKLTPDEQHMMNKIFPKIKKNFSDSFGLNNKSLNDSDITQFIRHEIIDNQLERKIVPVKTELGEEALAPAEEGLKAIGSGLPHRVLPSKFVFGKIKIDLNKLFYRNIIINKYQQINTRLIFGELGCFNNQKKQNQKQKVLR
jgi:hypothetical protein